MVTREARKKCFSNLSYFVKRDPAVLVVLVLVVLVKELLIQDVLPDDVALADNTNRETERHL